MTAPQQNPSINWSSKNLNEEWKRFEQHANLMFQGPLKRASVEEQAAYLLIWAGPTGRDIFNSWGLSDADSKNIETLLQKFREHAQPKTNTVFARYVFQERRQMAEEPFDTFVTDLRNLVKECKYGTPEEMVRDKIVSGVYSKDIREKLLNEGDTLTMEKAIGIAINYETTQQHLKSMAGTASESVDVIRRKKQDRPPKPFKPLHKQDRRASCCLNCGGKHARLECPAFGNTCHKCGKVNHWAKVCLSAPSPSRRVYYVEEEEDEDEEKETSFFIDSIDKKGQQNTAVADITTNTGETIRFKLDTGSQANIIPLSTYNNLKQKPHLDPSSSRLFGYTGKQLSVKGIIRLNCSYKGQHYSGDFHIVETSNSQAILGLQACLKLQVIQLILSIGEETAMSKEKVLSDFPHIFTGLGELEGEVKIHLKSDATPVVHPARRIPHAIKDKLKQELDKMENTGVIEKVTKPTDWVNSLVVVEKADGKLRICLDPRDLNTAIKRPHYPMPTLDDALSKMAGARYFSKLDAKSGYWQMKLDDESSCLTTFNSPFGRYKFRRLPFGIVCAQDEFQRKMDEIFEELPGVTPLIDDVIIHGKTQEEHDVNLKAALNRASDRNLKLNPEKLEVGVNEITYFGHVISSDGLKPDPEKVKAITEMPPPTDKKELQTLLGMITYLSRFAPQLSEITKPMRDLLKDETEFIWDVQQNSALQRIKDIITSQPVLAFFDPKKEVRLEVDASKFGLGAAIFQEQPIAFASKALTTTEQNYAQIEKELYAILFGCRRFHQYLYGREVTVHTDHKPLESIAKKPLAAAPPRLQRMLLQLQKYSLKIVHVPGKHIPVADALSRKYIPALPDDNPGPDIQIHTILHLPVSDQKMQQLQQATSDDSQLQALSSTILHGWPETKEQCPPSISEFFTFRDELAIHDGLILKGYRILVPKSLRPEMLSKVHSNHLGIEKTKQRAREVMFWPGMATDIHNLVAMCPICAPKGQSNPKEPLLPHDVPSRPWQKVGTDLFTLGSKTYLVTVDYYSRYFEVDELQSTTSTAIIRKLSAHFARHGIPEIVVSDNGPQYSAEEFKTFANNWDFKHVTSSPGYPQSNGLAEKTVQTVKDILSKAKADGHSALLSILEYRSTPVDGTASPAQLLMSRQLRSILPTTSELLKPKLISPSDFMARRHLLQSRQKHYYDRSAHPLVPMKPGNLVYAQLTKGGDWMPAEITNHSNTPRSFTIQTSDGGTFRRNRRYLKNRIQTPPAAAASGSSPETSDLPADGAAPASPTPSGVTVTRAGRTVKPPERLDL